MPSQVPALWFVSGFASVGFSSPFQGSFARSSQAVQPVSRKARRNLMADAMPQTLQPRDDLH